MAIIRLSIEEFHTISKTMPVLDVRSPGEYAHAHIPGALSFPIFSNEERRIIGTAYKQESREKAIKLGLDFFGKNMVKMVEEAETILRASKHTSRDVALHCWRGGMRSSAMAWLLDLYGFKVHLLTGGYKSYRHWVLEQLEKNYALRVLGGFTGGNKTGILHELKRRQEPVIDLEGLAAHKGSAFGNLNADPQPSQEHFENLLAEELLSVASDRAIWIEGESQRLGLVNIPFDFYSRMLQQPMILLEIPFEARLDHICKDYGAYGKEKLINAIVRIKKKLGGLETKNAVNALLEDDVRACFTILLHYYDKLYQKNRTKKETEEREIVTLSSPVTDATLNTDKLIQRIYGNR